MNYFIDCLTKKYACFSGRARRRDYRLFVLADLLAACVVGFLGGVPAGATGVCADCDSPDRICKVTAIFDRRPTGMPTKVIVVDADLGY